MECTRLQIHYSGHVQGVGFRHTVRQMAMGFDVAGEVRNLADGRVELIAEGRRDELTSFQEAIREAGLASFIRHEQTEWGPATGGFRGFAIAR